jgi:hypothetical protein
MKVSKMETIENKPGAAAKGLDRSSLTAMSRFLGGAILLAAGGALLPRIARAQTVTDADILNFALNLEYIEAEYYTLGTTGGTIEAQGIGVGGVGTPGGVTVKSSPQVPFASDSVRQFALELAANERAHVNFLRNALGGAAVARPQLDLLNSFNAAAQAAGIGATFDPFANDTNFLLGGWMFEDAGVTAYKGAARLLSNKDILDAAAGILAAEAYHVGGLRTRIFAAGSTAQTQAQQISDLRDATDGAGDKDQPVAIGGTANIIPADNNAIAFGRTTSEVLRIVYLTPGNPSSGGFFPNGFNGNIRTA